MRNIILAILYLNFLFPINAFSQETVQAKVDTLSYTYYMSLVQEQVGKKASDWKLKDTDGKEIALSDYSGKLILLEFWGVGCGACIIAAKDVCLIDSLYKTKGLAVIGIEGEGRNSLDKIKKFKQDYGFNYLTLVGGKETARKYGVRAFPTFFLIDKSGKIIYSHLGYFYGNKKDELLELIEKNI
ncbi:TlpA family protein disulfide reductase [Tenuifilum thalassicum]|uniref:TlpA family protein disulfide reductase n=1 Tax=Tenuifilum thalassicum TaxID=2590900 RepID=A0A7D4BBA6_9BACT|nr:TlpA disulfide reductase family protein [Tenuifilum thalassicum]QKG79880.1 TlpA family protein disulfide reductase [Tenuifilum thalassicum]